MDPEVAEVLAAIEADMIPFEAAVRRLVAAEMNAKSCQKHLAEVEAMLEGAHSDLRAANEELRAAQAAVQAARTGVPTPSETAALTVAATMFGSSVQAGVVAIILAMPLEGATDFASIRAVLRDVDSDAAVRTRLGKAKAAKLVTSAGWGRYALTPEGRALRQQHGGR
jgi:exonuclease VII small subunit